MHTRQLPTQRLYRPVVLILRLGSLGLLRLLAPLSLALNRLYRGAVWARGGLEVNLGGGMDGGAVWVGVRVG